MESSELFQKSINIIRSAGELLLDKKSKEYRVVRKGEFDFITELDIMVQNYVIDKLKLLSAVPIVSEEQKASINNYNNCFILDPIDGTHNLIAGLDIFGISLALISEAKIQFGISYFPVIDKLYTAFVNEGAYNNGSIIKVSDNNEIKKSIIGYDNNFSEKPDIINNFININENIFTVRISGSAAYDCCQVAEGNLDARIFNNTKLCDIAAGKIIVEEAGGKITDFNGDDIHYAVIKDIIISSNQFHHNLEGIIK